MSEIQTLAKISNPYIVGFQEMIKTKNNYYFVYEYCNGGDLESRYKTQKTFPEEEALTIFKQLLMAFKTLVDESILHRSFKKNNIFHYLNFNKIKLCNIIEI